MTMATQVKDSSNDTNTSRDTNTSTTTAILQYFDIDYDDNGRTNRNNNELEQKSDDFFDEDVGNENGDD